MVDGAVREALSLAPASVAYARALAAALPPGADGSAAFVGSRARLARLVASLVPAVAAAFAARGMDLPPWRRSSALMVRWAEAAQLEARLAVGEALPGPAEEETAHAAARAQTTGAAHADTAPPSTAPLPVPPAAPRAVIPVIGFRVGSPLPQSRSAGGVRAGAHAAAGWADDASPGAGFRPEEAAGEALPLLVRRLSESSELSDDCPTPCCSPVSVLEAPCLLAAVKVSSGSLGRLQTPVLVL